MKKYKDILIIGLFLIVLLLGNFLLSINQEELDELTIVKNKIKDTKRVVVAIGEQKQIKKDDKKYTYDYHGNKYEIVKEITDEEEVNDIIDIILNSKEKSDDAILTSNFSTRLFELFGDNKKIAEFNFQYITIGYNTKINVYLDSKGTNKLVEYYASYYKMR